MNKAVWWSVAGFVIPMAFGCSVFMAFIWAVATAAVSTLGN